MTDTQQCQIPWKLNLSRYDNIPILLCLLPQFTSHDWKEIQMANNLGMAQLQPEAIPLQSMQTAAKGTISSLVWGQENILPSERQQLPDSSSRLVSTWLFQQQLLHQQLFYVSSKKMKCRMGAGWNRAGNQSSGWAVCTWKNVWAQWLQLKITWKLVWLLHSWQSLPSTSCDAPGWLWWTLPHQFQAGNREEQKSGRDRVW